MELSSVQLLGPRCIAALHSIYSHWHAECAENVGEMSLPSRDGRTRERDRVRHYALSCRRDGAEPVYKSFSMIDSPSAAVLQFGVLEVRVPALALP